MVSCKGPIIEKVEISQAGKDKHLHLIFSQLYHFMDLLENKIKSLHIFLCFSRSAPKPFIFVVKELSKLVMLHALVISLQVLIWQNQSEVGGSYYIFKKQDALFWCS